MLGKLKDMYSLQKQAKTIKKQLANTHIEAESGGITVQVSCDQQLLSISISPEAYEKGASYIEKQTKEAVNRANKKAQEVSAEKMKGIMGEMGFPGA